MSRSFEETQEIRADIAERYNMVFPDVVLEPLWFGRRQSAVTKVAERFAIVDQNTDTVFNVCTDMYKPVYHEEVIKQVEEAAAMLPEYGKVEIKVSLLADGGKLKVNAVFPEVDYKVKNSKGVDDIFHPNSDIFSSYDLGWKYKATFGAYRLVCSNGLTVGEVFEKFKKRHLVGLDPNELKNMLGAGMERFSEQTQLWQRWADDKILPEMYTNMWDELPFSAPEKEKIENLKEAGTGLYLPAALKSGELTRWDMYNVITQYATHEIKSELRRVEVGPSITRIFEKFDR